MRVYVAAPLFCQAERGFNAEVAAFLRGIGHEVVLPQEGDAPDLASDKCQADREEALLGCYRRDVSDIGSCDALVIVLDGRVPDEGACFELGYATARGKLCVGLKTDVRVSEFGCDNAMLTGALGGRVARSIPELERLLPSDGGDKGQKVNNTQ